jgi:uncharacterized protein with GYD domain
VLLQYLFALKFGGAGGPDQRRCSMPLYVGLIKMTGQGASKIRNLASGYAKWKAYADSLGFKPICALACFGEYDFVVAGEYPNEAAALKAAGYAVALGDVQVHTLPSCQMEDFFKAMSELPK